MARVTAQEVQAIIKVSDDADLQPHIEAAMLIVDEDIVGNGLTDARLKQIELYLAAHFTALTQELGGLISDKTLNAEADFSDVYEAGLKSTRYGQQAINFDSSGTLANQATPTKQARFTVV